jgi:regulator of sigma E protease
MSILIFLVVLFLLILVHEWGHFIVAKKTGMRVDEFGIGFPPKLFGVKRGETEYTLNALPIGGFVKIWGENYEDAAQPETADAGRGFSSRPKWAQALVLVAGVTMNVIFAWLLFAGTYMIGVPTAVTEAEAGPDAELYIGMTIPDAPAAVLKPGSTILGAEAAGRVLTNPTPSSFTEFIQETAPAPLTVEYEYGSERSVVELQPTQGLIDGQPERYAVGASLSLITIQSMPVHHALWQGLVTTWDGLVAIVFGLAGLISQAFVGEADFSQVAGPVGIVGMVGDAAAFGITALMTFTAIISLNLAVINLLPVPALDGGRLVFVAIETVTGRPIPPEWAGRVNLVGFALLMTLMVLVTYNDIIRLF